MKQARSTGSHSIQNWGTPPAVFELATRLWGPYTLDAAAEPGNALCSSYFTAEQDGLAQSWAGHNTFCNPTFCNVGAWVEKASKEEAATLLVPAAFETAWFRFVHDWALYAVLLSPRIAFVYPQVPRDKHNQVIPLELLPKRVNGPPTASMLVRFKAGIQARRAKNDPLPVYFVDLRGQT